MSCPTLAAIKAEAARVYGPVLDVFERRGPARDELTVLLSTRTGVEFFGRSKAAARKLALETLRSMPSAEGA